MSKKIEKLFKSYRDQLLHLAKLYGIVEIKSYARSSKRLTVSQLELLLIKNHIKLPINRSSDKALAKEELKQNTITNIDKTVKNPNYKSHKNDGILYTNQILCKNDDFNKWSSAMNTPKKDDLADAFLQGLWYFKNQNIILYADDLNIKLV